MIGLTSTRCKEEMKRAPIPLIANTRSVITAPPSKAPISVAMSVAIGMSMLRKAWRTTTVRSDRPLARAVRM